MLTVRFRNGRSLGKVEEAFAASLSPGDTFFFAGISCEVEKIDTEDLIVHASKKPARIPTYGGARMPLSTSLADRVRGFLHDRGEWRALPRRRARMARDAGSPLGAAQARPAARRDVPARGAALYGRLLLRGVERAAVARHAADAADGDAGAAADRLRRQRLCGRHLLAEAGDRSGLACSRTTSWRTSSSSGCRDRTCSSAPSARWR